MKKRCILLIVAFTLFFIGSHAQNMYIPDANFRAYLNAEFPTFMDGDNLIASSAATYTGEINISDYDIIDLTGIELFTNITSIKGNHGVLEHVDLSNNLALTSIKFWSNQLTELDVSHNTALTFLDCRSNQLSTLDVSNNLALTTLNCSGNSLTSIDVTNNTALIELKCRANQLTELDISNNLALTTLYCSSNQLTELDLNNCTNLTNLACSFNQLTALDLSNCTNLEGLGCSFNQLTALDLSNCTNLEGLGCSSNQLTELDLSNNTNLVSVSCSNNQLIELDFSNNTNLVSVSCSNNQLIELDFSNIPNITALFCNNNNLSALDISNGTVNLVADSSFIAHNNPNLFCVQVDDVEYAQENFYLCLDEQVSFSTNCLYGESNPSMVYGSVLNDNDCVLDATPQGVSGIIVQTEPFHFFSVTDNLGAYSIATDTGYSNVVINVSNPLISMLCPSSNYHTVYFDTLGQDTSDINFFTEVAECPLLKIDVNSDRRRRCFSSNTYVEFCNDGFADASDVQVLVEFPEYVIFNSADHAFSINEEGHYVFDIGDLPYGECDTIHIVDSVACIEGITGLTQCTKAWILPKNTCLEDLDATSNDAWDHSSITVNGECQNNTLIQFTITNTADFGEGDMEAEREYRMYVDGALYLTNTFQLNGQESITIDYPANGQTVRLEADQDPNHPGNSHPQATIEACGYNEEGTVSMGFVDDFPQDDADYDVEIDCMDIRDSYDPNDKSVSPSGITENHYVKAGTELEYLIRFQNTGSDTAFTVIVTDTLSVNLNPATIQWGTSSHPYTVNVSGVGTPILEFTFNNINLPDSTTDELNSHGFVKFKATTYDDLSNGTPINNTAHIYFDYNTPITTNTCQVIVSDTVLTHTPVAVLEMNNSNSLNIYPNPTTGKLMVNANGIEKIEVYTLSGVLIESSFKNKIDLSHHPKGVYFVKVITENGTETRKVLLE